MEMKVLYLRDHETYLLGADTLTKFLAGDRSTDAAQYAPSHLAWLVAQQFVHVGEDHEGASPSPGLDLYEFSLDAPNSNGSFPQRLINNLYGMLQCK
jgi:hypothetical protein